MRTEQLASPRTSCFRKVHLTPQVRLQLNSFIVCTQKGSKQPHLPQLRRFSRHPSTTETILEMQSSTAPGLDLIRYVRLTSFASNLNRQVSPQVHNETNNIFKLLNLIAGGSLPWNCVRNVALFKKRSKGDTSWSCCRWHYLKKSLMEVMHPSVPLVLAPHYPVSYGDVLWYLSPLCSNAQEQ